MTDVRATVTRVQPLEERWLRLTFGDGAVHDVDLASLLATGGVFARIRDDRAVFETVTADPDTDTVAWPGEVDLDPYVLRGDFPPASGVDLPRRVVQAA